MDRQSMFWKIILRCLIQFFTHSTLRRSLQEPLFFREAAGSDILENDSLFTYAFTSEGILQCPLLLVDRYDTSRLMTSLSKEESNTWICSNPSCKHLNLTNVERCPFCLTYRSVPSLHVVFLLHGFRVRFVMTNS